MTGIFENNDLTVTAKHVYGFKGFPAMFHSHMEIVFVLEGSIRMQIDGIARTLQPGQLSISCPYVVHSYESAPEAEAIILLFSPASVPNREKQLVGQRLSCPYLEEAAAFQPLLERMVTHYANCREDLALDYLSAFLGELLLLTQPEPTDRTDLSATQKVLVFCAENYREDIGVKDIAAQLHISESYVSKIFSRKLGCSLRSYLNALRVAQAKELLKHTDRKITDVLFACGFRNQGSFNQVFLNHTGLTPRAYRQKHR